MAEEAEWFAGIDWASQTHQVCLIDGGGKIVGERAFAHDDAGLAELCAWLLSMSGAEPAAVAVAIEVPHGPIVETLLERGFPVYAINPKQLDRFGDRFTVAGVKDDRRDAYVQADSLRTDRHAFRRLSVDDLVIVELREWSRMTEGCRCAAAAPAQPARSVLDRASTVLSLRPGDDGSQNMSDTALAQLGARALSAPDVDRRSGAVARRRKLPAPIGNRDVTFPYGCRGCSFAALDAILRGYRPAFPA
jgi:Transposase